MQIQLNPDIPVRLILNLDEQSTKSNGYYDLKSGIIEELQYGIVNYIMIFLRPILTSVEVEVHHQDSYNSLCVQAADLIVGEIRHNRLDFLKNRDFNVILKRQIL